MPIYTRKAFVISEIDLLQFFDKPIDCVVLKDLRNTLLWLFNLARFTFLAQKISWWSQPIKPDWKIFSEEFARMWSIREQVLHVIRVGQVFNCFKENIWQNSWYLFIRVYTGLWRVVIPFLFKIRFPFCKRLMLKSPRRYI